MSERGFCFGDVVGTRGDRGFCFGEEHGRKEASQRGAEGIKRGEGALASLRVRKKIFSLNVFLYLVITCDIIYYELYVLFFNWLFDSSLASVTYAYSLWDSGVYKPHFFRR